MKKYLLYGILVALVLGAGFSLLKNANGNGEQYTLVTVTKGTIAETALAVGTIEPENEIKVKSTISGIISEISFKVGDFVEKGAPLFTILPNPTPLEYAEAQRGMEVAQVVLKQARQDRDRQFKLFQSQLISKSDMESVESQYNEAQLRFKIALERFQLLQKGQVRLSNKNIDSIVKAPITGVVLSREVFTGDPVVPLTNFQPGTELCAMADMNNLLFKGTVDEIDVGKLQPGMMADIKIGALPKTTVTGKLERISPKAKKDGNATLFDIEILIRKVEGRQLRAGFSATAYVKIQERTDTLLLPERLVIFEGDKRFVEIKEGETISKKEVKTGLSNSIDIEILEGLAEGDTVVQRPPREIQ